MKLKLIAVLLLGLGSFCDETRSHEFTSQATYLGNEGVMVNNEGVKILFDPFFHNSYGHYTLVPDQIRKAIFANEAPYNDIKALFISHAHEDHFDKNDVLAYLLANKKVKLVAPGQAVNML